MGLFNWQEIRGLQQPLADLRTSPDNTVWQACLLAIVAGYADAVGFLAFNAFAGAMTGNTVLLGIALAGGNLFDAAQSAVIIAAFVLGVAASAVLRRYVPLAALLGIEAAAIVAAALALPLVAAPILAFAMGVQNATMTHFAGTTLNTVFLTGNLQKLVEILLKRDTGSRPTSEGIAIALLGRLWLAYLVGVVLGAAAWNWTAYPLLLALLPLAAVLSRKAAWRRDG